MSSWQPDESGWIHDNREEVGISRLFAPSLPFSSGLRAAAAAYTVRAQWDDAVSAAAFDFWQPSFVWARAYERPALESISGVYFTYTGMPRNVDYIFGAEA